MKDPIIEYYIEKGHLNELSKFKRILSNDISQLQMNDIKSSGYVIDTLEASIWCLLKSKSYEEACLTAVNLGDDSDTTAAVTGGLAGIYYGYENIPKKWIKTIPRKTEITALAYNLSEKLNCE